MKLSMKFATSLTVLGVILTIIISSVSFYTVKTLLEEEKFQTIRNVARTCAANLDGDVVETFLQEGGNTLQSYKDVGLMMDKFKKENQLSYLILHFPTDKTSTAIYEATVEGDDLSETLPYGNVSVFTEISPEGSEDRKTYAVMYDNFINKKDIQAPMITDDEYGYLYAAYVNVYNSKGESVALIDASISMQSVRESLQHLLFLLIIASFAVIFALILVYLLFIRKILLKPIMELKKGMGEIAAGNLDAKILIKTGDEIEDLGHSANKMTLELKAYINNLSKITAEKERIGTELGVATKIQASMLPCIFPAFPERSDMDIFASMLPAKEVGGDFYDFFLIGENKIGLVIADVSGKGVPAALFMVIAKTLIKNFAQLELSAGEILTRANDQLCQNNDAGMFVTVFLTIIDLKTGSMTYANAGHNPPLIKRIGGEYEWFKTKPGFVLAGMDGISYKEGADTLHKGDKLYLYTDGVTEATNAQNELFSDPHLLKCVNKYKDLNMEELLYNIKNEIDIFVKTAPQFDDITMLGFEWKGTM